MQQKWKTISMICGLVIVGLFVLFFVLKKESLKNQITNNVVKENVTDKVEAIINSSTTGIDEKNIVKEKAVLDKGTYEYKNDQYNFSLNINNYLTLVSSTEITNNYLDFVGQKNVDFFAYANEKDYDAFVGLNLNIFTWDTNPEELFNKNYQEFLEMDSTASAVFGMTKPEMYLTKDGRNFYIHTICGGGPMCTRNIWTKVNDNKFLVFKFNDENSGLIFNNIEEDFIKPIISSFQEIK